MFSALWPDGRVYTALSDGQDTWSWHLAWEIARVLGGTVQPSR